MNPVTLARRPAMAQPPCALSFYRKKTAFNFVCKSRRRGNGPGEQHLIRRLALINTTPETRDGTSLRAARIRSQMLYPLTYERWVILRPEAAM